jgi:hypothetical protein
MCDFCGRVYCDILSIFLISQFCLLLRHQMMDKSKSTIRSIRFFTVAKFAALNLYHYWPHVDSHCQLLV